MNDATIFASLLILSAFCSGTETAFTALSEYSVAADAKNTKSKKLLLQLLEDKASTIAALLVGNNIVNTALAVYAGVVANDYLVKTGILPEGWAPFIASALTVIFLLIFGEVLPKQLGVAYAASWSLFSVFPLYLMVIALKPITRLMNIISRSFMRLLPAREEEAPSVGEIMMMAKDSEEAGVIDSQERKLMHKSSNFNDIDACDIMTATSNIVAASENISYEEIVELFRDNLYSRIPIYNGSIDNIIGIFNYKELFTLKPNEVEKFSVKNHLMKPVFAPENIPIGKLMDMMKKERVHMAIIVNEYGATAGVITMEDIFERIFGLISDEYDSEKDERTITHNKAMDETEMLGSISLQDLSNLLHISFSEKNRHNSNTLNGFLTDLKGDFLKEGDEIIYSNFNFKVLSVVNRCAEKVRVKKAVK